MTKLTAADIDDFYAFLLRRGGRDSQPLSAATVRRVHVVLHRALVQALRWEWIWSNPAALASPPRVEPAEIRPPSVEQVRHLLGVVGLDDLDFFTYLHLAVMTGARRSLHLAVMTGARRSQVLAMRWSDVDFDHAALGFSRALVAGFVFRGDVNGARPWQPNWVTKRFIAYRRRAGLAGFRLHDLRHFMATVMLAAGVPVPVVSERLCHARTSTTVNIYAHAMPGATVTAPNSWPALWRRYESVADLRNLVRPVREHRLRRQTPAP